MSKKNDDEVTSSTARATTRVWKDFQKQLIEEDLTMQEAMDEALLDWLRKRGVSAPTPAKPVRKEKHG